VARDFAQKGLGPDFPDGSVVSAWRLRLFPGKPSVSDDFLPKRQRNPMGDSQKNPLRVDFDRQIKLEFHGSTITSDAGLLAYRELDNALGLTRSAASGLHDTRTGQNTQHGLLALLRQSLYSRLAGYEDANDAERLCLDPAMRIVVGGRAKDQTAASTSEMARFETETLSTRENLKHLIDLSGKWIDQAHRQRKLTKLILDMDSSVSETYGHQEGSAYNGYFACTCYHPLFLFNQFGDLERVMLRRGNHPSAKFWRRVLLPVIERYRDRDIPKYFRGDSAFALPKLLRLLEKEGFRYAIRLKANPVLERKIAHLLKRPVGRPSRKPKKFYASFRYRAGSWDQARRVVAKVEWHAGELFPRVGFIVTNLKWQTKRVVRFYNRRGTAEQWIKEGKNAVKWTKLSCRRFKDNEARLQLFALAYNLANFLRQLVLPKPIQGWTLTMLREKLIKIGAKVVAHAKSLTFQLAEVAVPRKLFARILERIARLRPACASG
jgi:Transposase DDE domain group 1